MAVKTSTVIRARAICTGARIDTRGFEGGERLSSSPLTLRTGENRYAVLFRFGVAVLIGFGSGEETEFLRALAPFVRGAFAAPASEEAEIEIDPGSGERVKLDGTVVLREAGLEQLQVVSHVLAKSAVLAHYEQDVSGVFERVETLADRLRSGIGPAKGRDMLRGIGNVLLIQARTIGRVEVAEKPELTWDEPELDRLYVHLAAEYELRERDVALTRKLELIYRMAETYLNLLQNRQTLRVEWYIVILILVEILILLYEIFWM